MDNKSREKILYNLKKAQFKKDNELLTKINDVIWEFRTLHRGKAYRLFAFWDYSNIKGKFIVATHGLLKKQQKTPLQEIRKAERIRKQYLESNRQQI